MRLFEVFGRRRKTETWQRTAAEDPETFFYVREWLCKVGGKRDQLATALGLAKPTELDWVDGILDVDRDRRYVFVVEYGDAVFVFAQGNLVSTDAGARVTRGGGSAYTIFLDDRHANITLQRAIDGQLQAAAAPGDAPLNEDRALALAASWGPDPRELVRARPRGWRYTR
jgi:hypothetical protein